MVPFYRACRYKPFRVPARMRSRRRRNGAVTVVRHVGLRARGPASRAQVAERGDAPRNSAAMTILIFKFHETNSYSSPKLLDKEHHG